MASTLEAVIDEMAKMHWRDEGHKQRMEELLRKRKELISRCDIVEYTRLLAGILNDGALINLEARYSVTFSSKHYIINVAWFAEGQEAAQEARQKRLCWLSALRKLGWAVSTPVTEKAGEEKAFRLEATIWRAD